MADVLVDAGALIALLDRSDRHHNAVATALGEVRGTLITVWPALTEAIHLLGRFPVAQEAVLDMVDDDVLRLAELDATDVVRVKTLMRKYRDTPMDLADAALVRVAERDKVTTIVSLDRHFRVYALPGRRRFRVLPA